MSAVLGIAHEMVTEVTTEISTAEIALWVISASVVGYIAAGILAHRARRAGADDAAAAGFLAVQAAALLALVAILAVHAHTGGWLTSADPDVTRWFVAHRSPDATTAARAITEVGSPGAIAALAVLASVVVGYRQRAVAPAVRILAALAIAATASTVLKPLVARSRPPTSLHLVTESDFSFPSGHVTGTTALLVALVLAVPSGRAWGRVAAAVIAVCAIAAIAMSRLYLGVHWFTDVVAGALLGLTAVTVVAALAVGLRSARTESPEPTRPPATSRP